MATLDYDTLLKDVVFDENSLSRAISESFSCDVFVSERYDDTVHMEAYSDKGYLFGIYLTTHPEEMEWDSDIIGGTYTYNQHVCIAIDKGKGDVIAETMRFYVRFAKINNIEMLIKSYMDGDICYVKDSNPKWNESFYRNHARQYIR
ncbi:hypothetical protein [Butyrivibrio sp. WCD3002]|uniref:hypothetical protein n=1 Tax=Butyrivibrio sp. WCD3002 TaxID=1280676 RepID=UPI0003F703B2|nr:hypothetical protein [Butyrivibrio sp. WCD3002]